ncbi:MAG: type III-A CRISPR-associated RAMP protein Csm4 [Methanocalculus sp.]|uniref:type III-A CRISPR-associated RAMP protein Csm4 n=1 Tax=Methanocalculus sp. TaxID=2004547 RepID=UPI00271E2313|nr:type III-A CRISPR-associated RAMP protein Csm4 [Methanocalculus sp.]MDO9539324.1 type III-A CRISPR-associated RAMP protein Csm4 [Methanocalculus sp.]
MRAVYLTPRSLFPGSLPSNTLFGAICHAMADLGGPVDELIAEYASSPPFLLTSAFPFIGEKEKIHFLPKPIQPITKMPKEEQFDAVKKIKKVSLVSSQLFSALLKKEMTADALIDTIDRYTITKGMCYTGSGDVSFSIEKAEVPHNRINRLSTASEAFFATDGYRYHNAGLYFMIDFRQAKWEPPVMAALRLLEDRGFGSKISSGGGQCSISSEDRDILPQTNGDRLVTLSRYYPSDFKALGEDTYYTLVRVRGRSTDGMMKKSVMMLGEGSVFPDTGSSFYGGIARVRDDPPVVEYGYAFPVRFGGTT